MKQRIPMPRLARPGALASILVLLAPALTAAPAAAAPAYGSGGSATVAAPSSVQLGTMSTSALGVVLTGPNGMTLYTLSSDPNNGSVCTGQCLALWPPLLVAAGGTVTGPSGSSLAFAAFTRSDDATTQVTRNGRPLYYFKNDSAPGQADGGGIKALGGVWHVAGASAVAAATGGSAGSSGYGGSAGSSVPPTTTRHAAPATSGAAVPIGMIALALGAFVAAFVGIRRLRRVRNR